ncbi:dr1-associated corepressor [Hemiscyllium ocellatum]|uniref:dr1-associated corepressor n=1 Tax=Hemiscyllium ocellatum TaxID=170820 RepID=UPI0029676CFA|nr:dr1-associated corepressor [Hemiscyllium ocellatum]
MPSKKKKYNARFPPARIKKIMQTDEEIGKVAAAVPVIISRALELFLDSLLTKACHVTQSRNAKTMTTSHLKQCIELEQQFDFLKDLVASVPDMQGDNEDNHMEGDKTPRRGRKPGSGRRNTNGGAGPGPKAKDRKQSSTESEQEEESEDSETDEEEASRSSADKPGRQVQSPRSVFSGPLPALPVPTCSPALGNLPMPAATPMCQDGGEDDDYDS